MIPRFYEHVRLERLAYSYEFRFDRVLCNQMYIYVHWHNDVMNSIDHRNGNQNLRKTQKSFVSWLVCSDERVPVKPSFLLHVSQLQRLRFFFSGVVSELHGEASK